MAKSKSGLEKLFDILDKMIVDEIDTMNLTGKSVRAFIVDNRYDEKNILCVDRRGRRFLLERAVISRIGGCIGGKYNRGAIDVVYALNDAKIISGETLQSFLDWWAEEERKGSRLSRMEDLRKLAAEFGVKLPKNLE